MVDWMSPDVLALTAFAFAQATVFMLGLYLWYFVLSLRDVEWELLVVRRHQFKLAHVPYLVGRYAHLMAAVGIAVSTHSRAPASPCSGLAFMRFLAVTEEIALAAASSNLALRAMTLWGRSKVVQCTVGVISCVHIVYGTVLGIAAVTVRVDPIAHVCFIKATPGPLLAFFIFTFVWDVVIMALTLWGIHLDRTYVEAATPLKDALVRQGVGYAVVTTLTCVPMAVVYALQLNEVMNVFLIPVGCTFSVIASSAAVTSLVKLQAEGSLQAPAPSEPATLDNSKAPVEFSTVVDLRSALGPPSTSMGSWRREPLRAVAEDGADDGADTEAEDSSMRPLTRPLAASAASLGTGQSESDVELGYELR